MLGEIDDVLDGDGDFLLLTIDLDGGKVYGSIGVHALKVVNDGGQLHLFRNLLLDISSHGINSFRF